MSVEFRILGPLEILDDGRPIQLGAAREEAVLGILLLHPNEVVSTERLIDELWGSSPSSTAAKTVQVYISRLRRALQAASGDQVVATRAPGYVVQLEPEQLDAARFERLVAHARAEAAEENPERAAETFRRALSLWRGRALAGLEFQSFAKNEIARLEDVHLSALIDRIDCDLVLGRHEQLIGELERLVAEHPYSERLRQQLMLALYRAGRQADALAAYRDGRKTLMGELGLEPSPALQRLERAILGHDPALQPPPLRRQASRAPVEPPTRPARTLRSRVVVLTAALLALAGVAALALARGSGNDGLDRLRPNSVGVIDPISNAMVGEIPAGIRPGPVAIGAGSVWVGNLDDRTVTRIDAKRREATATIPLGEQTPSGLVFAGTSIWVAHGLRGTLSRIDPGYDRVTNTFRVARGGEIARGGGEGTVAGGDGVLWAIFGDSTVVRLDPATGRVDGRSFAGSAPAGVALGQSSLWVVNSGEATVYRFNPGTFEAGPTAKITVGSRPTGIAVAYGAAWVTNTGDDLVSRIDARTNSASTIRVGDRPTGIVAGAGAIWVANKGSKTVSRIDPSSREVVETIRVGSTPSAVAFGHGYVWVSAQRG